MLRLIGIVVTIGLADSLNPTTIGPALYLATGEHSSRRVFQFTVGVFAVYLLGGVVIALGPGQLLLSLVPHPKPNVTHAIEIGVGVAMLVAAVLLWRHRHRLSIREVPQPQGKTAWVLGATITVVELPTAFPYFAAIAAIVGSGEGPLRQLTLLVLFNICFVLPLAGIWCTLTFAGDHAERVLSRWRNFLQRRWPILLAGLALLAGLFVILLGATGFSHGHGHVGRFMRKLRHALHP